MQKNYIFFIIVASIFIIMEFSHINFNSLYKTTDDKIASLFLKSKKPKKASKHIVIVDMDAISIKKLGQWPFSREKISKALINLTDAGAGIIGFDMVFSDPDRLSPHAMAKQLGLDGEFINNDEILAQTIMSQ